MFGNPIGSHIIQLEETDSTNSYASRILHDEFPEEGTVIVAGFQHAGRGQRESGWESERNHNLLVSYILYPTFLEVSNHFVLNQAMALGVCEFIQSLTHAEAAIKWPNDILAGNKKIAGLLIENAIRNNKFSSTIVGIGININQAKFKNYLPEATSIYLQENHKSDLKFCLNKLSESLDKWYAILQSGNYKKITDAYAKALFGSGKEMQFESENKKFSGIIKGVNNKGQLLLLSNEKGDQVFNYKELKYLF